jgi:hypothetical protein
MRIKAPSTGPPKHKFQSLTVSVSLLLTTAQHAHHRFGFIHTLDLDGLDWLWGKSIFCKLFIKPCPLVCTLRLTHVRWTKRACFDIGKDLLDRIGRGIPTLEHLFLHVQNTELAKWSFKKLGMCKLLKGCHRIESITILGAEPDLSALRLNPDGSDNTVTRHVPAPQLRMIKVPGKAIEHAGAFLENLLVCT